MGISKLHNEEGTTTVRDASQITVPEDRYIECPSTGIKHEYIYIFIIALLYDK